MGIFNRRESAVVDLAEVDIDSDPYVHILVEQGVDLGNPEDPEQRRNSLEKFLTRDTATELSPLAMRTAGHLRSVLRPEVVEDAQAAEKRNAIVGGLYENELTARETMWEAMIGSAVNGRAFTPLEKEFYKEKISEAESARRDAPRAAKVSSNSNEFLYARGHFDAATLERDGLMYTDQVVAAIDQAVGNVMDGTPTLIVGDKGIAKTQVAKKVARLVDKVRGYDDEAPSVVSGAGDVMSDMFKGKDGLDKDGTHYEPGVVYRNQARGRITIIDEVNKIDPAILGGLNDTLLISPGKKQVVQEDQGREITVQPGYGVIATANEASARFRNNFQLDGPFRDRFAQGGGIIRMEYPDSNVTDLGKVPHDTLRLAIAAKIAGTVDKHHSGISNKSLQDLAMFVHETQRVYSTPARDIGNALKQNTGGFVDADEPGMDDCITPRSLYGTVRKASADNKPGFTIDELLPQMIDTLDQDPFNRKNAAMSEAILNALGIRP